MRRRILVLPVAIALATVPAALDAQACVGIPVAESHNAFTAGVGFPENATSYGAELRRNVAGPVAVAASYSLSSYDNVEPKQHSFGVEADYEVPGLSFSACPLVGLGYSRMSEDGSSLSVLSVPVGVGFGKSIQLSRSAALVPHVVPQWVWSRATFDLLGEEISDNDSSLAAVFGATVATPRFYFGGRVLWTDQDNVDPTFSLIAGLPF